jgi:hypothetical protein
MDTERLVEDLGEHISRRRFVKDLGAASLATVLALLGLPSPASASHGYCHCCSYPACCVLCCSPGGAQSLPTCSGGGHNYKTKWCWYCDHTNGRTYKCCEAKDPNTTCDRDCNKVYASWYQLTGYGPVQGE